MFECRGLTALVTGASSGLGAEFSRRLARMGANLILVARSKKALNDLAAGLRDSCGVRVHVIEADLSVPGAPESVFNSVQKAGLAVDLLVNNAGFGRFGVFDGLEAAAGRDMIAVNIHALVVLTHFFLPNMLENGRGGIINVASTAGFQPIPFFSLYAASKAFVIYFTEALWAEYAPRGIRVFCLCPGNTRTRFHQTADIPAQKVFGLADAGRVVAFGMRTFCRTDKPTAIYGFFNRIIALGCRIFPRSWMVRIAGGLYRI